MATSKSSTATVTPSVTIHSRWDTVMTNLRTPRKRRRSRPPPRRPASRSSDAGERGDASAVREYSPPPFSLSHVSHTRAVATVTVPLSPRTPRIPYGDAVTDVGMPTGPITRGSVARVGVATVLTALCGYLVLYLAARDLDPAGFSVFGVFWGAFGLVTGAAFGLLQEATREVRSARCAVRSARSAVLSPGPQTHPLRVAAVIGVTAGLLIAASAPLWAGHVFVAARWTSVVLLSVGLAGFCLHATLLGMLAGAGRWTQYGSLMVTDAGLRVAVAAATFALSWGLVGFLWGAGGGGVGWL